MPDKKNRTRASASKFTVGKSVEHRRNPRIYAPFPAHVSGADVDGKQFEIVTVVDNLSADSVYLRLMPCVERGARLSLVIELVAAHGIRQANAKIDAANDSRSLRIAIKGRVMRVDEKPGGACGVAIFFEEHEFSDLLPSQSNF
ncbi:MAG: hypothetical protein NVSMB56_09190 [Pyrinomonadaceae bacterium]